MYLQTYLKSVFPLVSLRNMGAFRLVILQVSDKINGERDFLGKTMGPMSLSEAKSTKMTSGRSD